MISFTGLVHFMLNKKQGYNFYQGIAFFFQTQGNEFKHKLLKIKDQLALPGFEFLLLLVYYDLMA